MLKYKKNVFSQNGEDGIIEYIFNKLDIKSGNFIEFGAWDGKHLSNTYNLFLNKNWNGIYIESDKKKFNDLLNNFKEFKNRVDCINSMVGYKSDDNLDYLIEKFSKKRDFDFISIDVDGLDGFIFNKMNKYMPKVICIEVNAGHDPEYPKIIPDRIAMNNIGQSIKVMNDLGISKGYFSLCYTGNLFLVKNEYKHLFNDVILNTPTEIYLDFLNNLDINGIKYLKNIFVIKKIYNNFYFDNKILTQFCILNNY